MWRTPSWPGTRYATALLVLGVVLVALFALLPNALIDWRRHARAGSVMVQLGLIALALGMAPRAWARLLRLAAEPRRLARRLWLIMGGAVVAVATIIALWPEYAARLLGREAGLAEPAQVLLYVSAAFIAFKHAALLPPDDGRARAYRIVGWGAIVFVAEEADYFGLFTLGWYLLGQPDGRIHGRQVGNLHELLNIPAASALASGGKLAFVAIVLAVVWGIRRSIPSLVREVGKPEARPLALAIPAFLLSQLFDIGKSRLGLAGLGLPLKAIEESAEVVAALAVVAWLTRVFARSYVERRSQRF